MANAAAETQATTTSRWLDPIDRISEVWFGLIIVLTFTCTLSVKTAGHEEVHEMLLAAFLCNVSWGILDAFMYLANCFVRRARGNALYRVARNTEDIEKARAAIKHALPPVVAAVLGPATLDEIQRNLRRLADVPERPALSHSEWLAGLGVFLAVSLATVPVALPFVLMHQPIAALRTSNAIALVMLFMTGYAFGKYAGYHKWLLGFAMLVLGSILVAVTIYLGG